MSDAWADEIAKLFHDETIQSLSAVVLRLGILKNKLKDSSDDEILKLLTESEAGVSRAVDSIRDVMERIEKRPKDASS